MVGEQHIDEAMLRNFADGKLTQDEDIAVEQHLLFCSGLCLAFLDSLPNAFEAVMAAIARRHRPGRKW
jgi:hypothetical protein